MIERRQLQLLHRHTAADLTALKETLHAMAAELEEHHMHVHMHPH